MLSSKIYLPCSRNFSVGVKGDLKNSNINSSDNFVGFFVKSILI